MKFVLVGYMGVGKTTIGTSFSQALNLPFYDLDALIEAEVKLPVSKIFEDKGEIYFRKIERLLLDRMLTNNQDFVLALGGGTPCYGNAMDVINTCQDVKSIYLKSSVNTLTNRLWEDKETRPLIAHLSSKELLNEFIRKHLFERAFYYNQAQLIIDTDLNTTKEVTEELILTLF